jgi:hypothetical protein
MYFEAKLNDKKYKVDVNETRNEWKISIQEDEKDWRFYDIPKSDYKRAESYVSFLFKGAS